MNLPGLHQPPDNIAGIDPRVFLQQRRKRLYQATIQTGRDIKHLVEPGLFNRDNLGAAWVGRSQESAEAKS